MHSWELQCNLDPVLAQGLSSYPKLLLVISCGRIQAHTVLAAYSSPWLLFIPNLDCGHSPLTGPLRKPRVLIICLFSCIHTGRVLRPEPKAHEPVLQGSWHLCPNLSRLTSHGHSALQNYIVYIPVLFLVLSVALALKKNHFFLPCLPGWSQPLKSVPGLPSQRYEFLKLWAPRDFSLTDFTFQQICFWAASDNERLSEPSHHSLPTLSPLLREQS